MLSAHLTVCYIYSNPATILSGPAMSPTQLPVLWPPEMFVENKAAGVWCWPLTSV